MQAECRSCGHQDYINVRSNGEPIFPFVCTKCLCPWYNAIPSVKTIEHSGQTCRVVEGTMAGLFRHLDEDEVAEFRAWAQAQPDGTVVNPVWHPVAQDQLLISGKGKGTDEAN